MSIEMQNELDMGRFIECCETFENNLRILAVQVNNLKNYVSVLGQKDTKEIPSDSECIFIEDFMVKYPIASESYILQICFYAERQHDKKLRYKNEFSGRYKVNEKELLEYILEMNEKSGLYANVASRLKKMRFKNSTT